MAKIPRSDTEQLLSVLNRRDPNDPLTWEIEQTVTKMLSQVYQLMNGITGDEPEPEKVKDVLRKRFTVCLVRRQWFWDADILFAIWEEVTHKPVCPTDMRKGLRTALNNAMRDYGLGEKK